MFEKDADYRKARKESRDSITKVIKAWSAREVALHNEGFKDGAEFGYNKAKEDADKMKSQFLELCNLKDMRIAELEKANEWHYIKDGDLPKEDVFVYLWFKGQEYPTVARRHLFKEWGRLKWCWDCKWGSGYTIEADNDRILAWKEIVLPELPKENE